IIRGGTSGLTVANRLAASPGVSVAVVEGGRFYEFDNGNISQIPALDVEYSSPSPASIQPLIDWGIVTEPQELWSKLFGLPTATHTSHVIAWKPADVCVRGSSGSYQDWADRVGDQSYTFSNILPFFRESPQFSSPNYSKRGPGSEVVYDARAFDAGGGPLHVSYSNFYKPISSFIKKAFLQLGMQNIAGLNGGKLIGFSEFTLTIDPQAGTRSSSETSFLQESLSSSTLQVYHESIAQKIIFSEEKTATGVKVVTAGTEYTLSAIKEVILAPGVVFMATSTLPRSCGH
ncbi:MAG: hypothetical protein Q9179_007720, partial [Wetmoreana sp. 5 TL-2023]